MKVGMYYNNRDVRVEEMPVPEIGSRELLVQVKASGICGSDVMEWYRIKRAPLVLGHEITGDLVQVGEDVKKYKKGDRVFVSHHVPCNKCDYCLSGHHTTCDTLRTTNFYPGGFAEYLRVPEINVDRGVFLLPESMSYEEGAFIEPLACVVRGQRQARIQPGNSLLVLGSGISGLLNIQLARTLGAGRVIATDINDYRMECALKFGAEHVIHANEDVPQKVRELNDDRLVNKVIICTGALSAVPQALESIDRGGTVLFFAPPKPEETYPVSFNALWRNEITLMTTYGASPVDITQALELIRAGNVPVKEMITHKLSLNEIALGFKLASEAKECIKVLIEPNR
jgi:L-iditol 2-dehydrogenase